MASDHEPTRRRCPVCWTTFTLGPRTPNKRYCCPACRIEDWRRRHQREQTQLLLDSALQHIRDTNAAHAERREALQQRHALDERRPPMNPD